MSDKDNLLESAGLNVHLLLTSVSSLWQIWKMPTYTLEQQQSTVQSWNVDPYMYVGLNIWVIPAQPTRIYQQAGPTNLC